MGDLKGQRGTETGGASPLVDAAVTFFEEFMIQEKEPPPTQQPPQQATGEKLREDKKERKEYKVVDSFEPMYMYEALKEKRQLKDLLVRSRATHVAP